MDFFNRHPVIYEFQFFLLMSAIKRESIAVDPLGASNHLPISGSKDLKIQSELTDSVASSSSRYGNGQLDSLVIEFIAKCRYFADI